MRAVVEWNLHLQPYLYETQMLAELEFGLGATKRQQKMALILDTGVKVMSRFI